MKEIYRICRDDAEIYIIAPHFSNPYYYSDPTHVRPFGLYTMHYFMDKNDQPIRKVADFYANVKFHVVYSRIDFYRVSLFDRITVPFIRYLVNLNFLSQDIYERRWSWSIPAWQIKYILRKRKNKNNIKLQTGKKYIKGNV